MNTNQICFSKRIMIVSLVGLFLVGLVFLSYSVSTKKTSTQTKAAPPSRCSPNWNKATCLRYNEGLSKKACSYQLGMCLPCKFNCSNKSSDSASNKNNNSSTNQQTAPKSPDITVGSANLSECPGECYYVPVDFPARGDYKTCQVTLDGKSTTWKCCQRPKEVTDVLDGNTVVKECK